MNELLVELEEAEAKRTVNRVREMPEVEPDLTGVEVLPRLEEAYEATRVEGERSRGENAPRRSTCRHCGYPVQTLGRDSGAWRHTDGLSAGCCAASFDRLGTWDDALNRSWKATPTTEAGQLGTRMRAKNSRPPPVSRTVKMGSWLRRGSGLQLG